MALFGKKKGLVGLDIGSSAIKAVELKAGGKGGAEYQLDEHRSSSRLPPEAIVDGAIMDSGAVIDAIQRLFTAQKIKTPDVCDQRFGQRGHRQEDQPAPDERRGAGGIDPLGGRAVHPLRHPGRRRSTTR